MRLEELLDDLHKTMLGMPKHHGMIRYYLTNFQKIHFDNDYESAIYMIENFNLPTRLQVMTLRHYLHNISNRKSRLSDFTLAQKMSECIHRLDRLKYIIESAVHIISTCVYTKKFIIEMKIYTIMDLHFDQLIHHRIVDPMHIELFITIIVLKCYQYAQFDGNFSVLERIFESATGKYRTYICYWLLAGSKIPSNLLLDKILSVMTHQDILNLQCDQTYVDMFIKFCSSRGNQKYVDKFMKKLLALGLDVHIKCSDGRRLIDCCKYRRLYKLLVMFE